MGSGFIRVPKIKTWGIFLLCIVLVIGAGACTSSKSPSEKRAEEVAAHDEIEIAIVDSSSFPSMFLEGVEFAVNEINQRGGVLGKKIEMLVYDDQGDDTKGWRIAKELAENDQVVAVVGHLYSSVAISASIVYEKAGILFLSPGAMDPSLTHYGGDFTFRNIPNGEEAGKQVADFGVRQGIKKIVVFYQREDTYKRLMENFNAQIGSHGVEVVTTRSFFRTETDFKPLLSLLKKQHEFDGIFIVGSFPAAGMLIKQIRDVGIDAQILGSTDLDSPTLWTVAGRAAAGTVVMTVFDPEQPTRLTREFVARFRTLHGVEPDAWAAQGCDAIQVLVEAMERSGSVVPIDVSSTLRFLENWEGVTGSYSFTINGDISGKSVFFKIARNGSFELLERERVAEVEIDPLYAVKNTTLRIALPSELDTIDPALIQTIPEADILEQLFLGLTSLDPETYEAVPALAKDWTVSADGSVYQFHLRQDVTWTDGLPVTAYDVVQTIQRNIAPDTDAPAASMLYVLKNGAAIHKGELQDVTAIGSRALDYFTVEFTLERPVVFFPMMLNAPVFRPLPSHVIEEYGEDVWWEPENIQTNGAYYLAAWEEGQVIILRQNLSYYAAEQVAIPELRYYIVHSPSVGMAMYLQDEIDILGGSYLAIPLNEISRIKNHPVLSQEYSNPPQFETVAYYFNTKRPPVDNVLVRKAIAAAIERQILVKLGTEGDKEPATTFTRPSILGSGAASEDIGIRFNPLQAKKWLTAAGYPDGEGFPDITLTFYPEHRLIAYPLKDFLKHYLHINVKLQEVSVEEYERLLYQSSLPHIFVFPWFADYPDPNNFLHETFHPFHSPNVVGWDDTGFIELVEKAKVVRDPKKREALYQQAERIICEEEVVVIPLYYSTVPLLVKPRVKNWYYMALGGQHIRNWALGESR